MGAVDGNVICAMLRFSSGLIAFLVLRPRAALVGPVLVAMQAGDAVGDDIQQAVVKTFKVDDDCGRLDCPHARLAHAHVLCLCPDVTAPDHQSHRCGFSLRSKAATCLADGVLSGWPKQTANAVRFAKRHCQRASCDDDDTPSDIGHYTSFRVCVPLCQYTGRRHSHCIACRCPDPGAPAAVHRAHACGFFLRGGDTHVLPDGVLVGWEGKPGNAIRHHARHHQPPIPSAIGAVAAWAGNRNMSLLPRDVSSVVDSTCPEARPSAPASSSGDPIIADQVAPVAGETLWLDVSRRVIGKQRCSWQGVATGASKWEGGELIVELSVVPLPGPIWRSLSRVRRDAAVVNRVVGMEPAAASIRDGLARSIRAGASTDILQALRCAHGRLTLAAPSQSQPSLLAVLGGIVIGVDVSWVEVGGGDEVPRVEWGRVLARDEDCDPVLLKVIVFQKDESRVGCYTCSQTKWLCATDVALAGLFFLRDPEVSAFRMLGLDEVQLLGEEDDLQCFTSAMAALAASLVAEVAVPSSEHALLRIGKVVELYPAVCPACGSADLERTRAVLDRYGLISVLSVRRVYFFMRCRSRCNACDQHRCPGSQIKHVDVTLSDVRRVVRTALALSTRVRGDEGGRWPTLVTLEYAWMVQDIFRDVL